MPRDFSDCVVTKDSVQLTIDELAKIFGSDFQVLKKTYPTTLCPAISAFFKCPFKSEGCNDGKHLTAFFLRCIIEPKKKYLLKYYKTIDETGNRNNWLEVLTNDFPQCKGHEERPEGRQLRGEDREKIKQLLLSNTPLDVSYKKIL